MDFNPVNESVKKLVFYGRVKKEEEGDESIISAGEISAHKPLLSHCPLRLSIARKVQLSCRFSSLLSRLNWKNIGRNQWWIRCFDNSLSFLRERNWNRNICVH